jgi:hypothetical protein
MQYAKAIINETILIIWYSVSSFVTWIVGENIMLPSAKMNIEHSKAMSVNLERRKLKSTGQENL